MNRSEFAGKRTRADVQAEVAAARNSDKIRIDEYAPNLRGSRAVPARNRVEVRAEARHVAHKRGVHELY